MKFNIFTKLLSKIHRFKGTTIIQFGPPRSGTTLIYNILKDIFTDQFVETRHYYRESDRKFPTIVTYRNPLDSISSSILRYGLEPTNEVIEKQILEFERNGIWKVLEIRNNKNVLMLKYENFFDNYDVIFNSFERFFNTIISDKLRKVIKERYNIESVEKIIQNMKSYKEIDKKTLYHGKHININKGRCNFHKDFLKEEQIKYLNHVYKDFNKTFNY